MIKLESLLKEQRTSGEKMQREINKLSVKKLNLESDLENANNQIENLDKEVLEKDKQLKDWKQSINRYINDVLG